MNVSKKLVEIFNTFPKNIPIEYNSLETDKENKVKIENIEFKYSVATEKMILFHHQNEFVCIITDEVDNQTVVDLIIRFIRNYNK